MPCTDCQTVDPAMTRATDISLSLPHVGRKTRRQQRKVNFFEFLNRHIAQGFMRNTPGWIYYK